MGHWHPESVEGRRLEVTALAHHFAASQAQQTGAARDAATALPNPAPVTVPNALSVLGKRPATAMAPGKGAPAKQQGNKCGPCSFVEHKHVPAKGHSCDWCKGCWGKGRAEGRLNHGILKKKCECTNQEHKR